MAGFVKGMATTSGWTLVRSLRCDCRTLTRIQDRASTDRLRAMKMAAAAGNGDEQDRIEGSTAHDPADGDDSFSFESLIFPVFLLMQLSTEVNRTSKLRRGYGRRPRLSRQHDNRKDNYGRNCNPALHIPKGDVCGSASMCDGPHAGFPRLARCQ